MKHFISFDIALKNDFNKIDMPFKDDPNLPGDTSVFSQENDFVADPTFKILTEGAGQQALYLQEADTTTPISVLGSGPIKVLLRHGDR